MSQADLSKLSLLSDEQQSALSDEQKAVFCLLSPADQAFFTLNFKPNDLPRALTRKGEILAHNRAEKDRLQRLQQMITVSVPASSLTVSAQGQEDQPKKAEGQGSEDIVTAVAAAVGLGAVAYTVATDNTARWQGVEPRDLVGPLKAEFEDQEMTDIEFEGAPEALEGTIFVVSQGRFVPALTINLTRVQKGVEVKMGDLTSRGVLETLRGGGEKLLNLAQKGMMLWARRGRGNPADLMGMANSALSDTAGLAETAGNLRLKERAWNVIKNTAGAVEKAYQDKLEQERAARYALEAAWDRYNACPTCAVPFGDGDTVCRVCGTARPEKPLKADPRA